MNKECVIARIAIELYDLKQKIEDIRGITEKIYNITDTRKNTKDIRLLLINILNAIDENEIYELVRSKDGN